MSNFSHSARLAIFNFLNGWKLEGPDMEYEKFCGQLPQLLSWHAKTINRAYFLTFIQSHNLFLKVVPKRLRT